MHQSCLLQSFPPAANESYFLQSRPSTSIQRGSPPRPALGLGKGTRNILRRSQNHANDSMIEPGGLSRGSGFAPGVLPPLSPHSIAAEPANCGFWDPRNKEGHKWEAYGLSLVTEISCVVFCRIVVLYAFFSVPQRRRAAQSIGIPSLQKVILLVNVWLIFALFDAVGMRSGLRAQT